MIGMTSMDKIATRLATCKNEKVNLCTVLEISKEEDEWMRLLQQLELKASLSGIETLIALQSLILSCSCRNALKNLMQLFLKKTSILINKLGILDNEELAQEALIIVNTFWSVCANKHAALLQRVVCRFSAEFYEVLPSLASIYVDLFISTNSSKIKIKKLSRKLYGWLNFELNERCIKTALLEVSVCSPAGAKILSPILIKLLSEPHPQTSESHLDYLLHFILLKRWIPFCDDLKDTAKNSLRIKAPAEFVQWLVQHWPQGSDYIPTDKSMKGRRVSELLLELDEKATEELIDVFSQCLVSDGGKAGDITETPEPVFVIDKKGSETSELPSKDKRPKKRRKIEHKPRERDEDVAVNYDLLMLPGNLKNKSTPEMQNEASRENETMEHDDDKEEAMDLDDSGEVDGPEEKKSDTGNNNVVVAAEKRNGGNSNNISDEVLTFFIDRNSKSPKKQHAALKPNSAMHYFQQKSLHNSRQLDETEKPVKNADMEIQIIDLRGNSEEEGLVHEDGESDHDLTILESPDMKAPDLASGQSSYLTGKDIRNALSSSRPSLDRDKQKAETLISTARNEHLDFKPLVTDVDLISSRDSSSEDNGQSDSGLMQNSPTFAMSRSPKKSQTLETKIVPASGSDESESGSPLSSVKRRKKNKSYQRTSSSSMSPEIEIIDGIDVIPENFNQSVVRKITAELDDRESISSASEVVDLTEEILTIESDPSGSDVDEQEVVIVENLTEKSNVSMSMVDTDAMEVSHEDKMKTGTSELEIGMALAEIRRSMNVIDKNQKQPSNDARKLRTKSEGSTNSSPNRRLKGSNRERTAVKSKTPKSTILTDWLRKTPSLATSSVVLHQMEDLMPENENAHKAEAKGMTLLSHKSRSISECNKLIDKKLQVETSSSSPKSSQSKLPSSKFSSELNTTDQPLATTTMPKDKTKSESMISRKHKIRSKSECQSNVKEAKGKTLLSSTNKKRTSLPNSKISSEINATEQNTDTVPKKRTPSPVKTPFTKLSQRITNEISPLKSPLTVEKLKSPSPVSFSPQNQKNKKNDGTPKDLTPNDIFGKSLRTYSKADSALKIKEVLVSEINGSPEKIKTGVLKSPSGLSDGPSSDSSLQKDQNSPLKRTYFLRGTATKRSECQACGLKQDCTKHQQSVADSDTGPVSTKALKKEVKVTTPSLKTPKKSPVNRRKSLRSSSNKL